ncbi:MAG: ABC transporter permease [Bacteroidales bacterium]|nr:ABC transporter permease [Bacteroidales bacterium]
MKAGKLIIRSLVYYFKRNLLLALGIAISTAVLTGSLIVGDSVKHSLNRIVEQRLGEVTHTMRSGERFFTRSLAERIKRDADISVAPVLLLDGMAVSDGGRKRINDIQVIGVDANFDDFAGQKDLYGNLHNEQVIISRNLADRLQLEKGDEFLVRMTRASLVPLNAPFVSDAESTVSMRVLVADIAGTDQLGNFNLKNSQTAPFNIFLSISMLSELMELGDRANLLLFSFPHPVDNLDVAKLVDSNWTVGDIGLNFHRGPGKEQTDIKSNRVFIDSSLAGAILTASVGARPVLTYFVNSLSHKGNVTPYSFVSTLPDSELDRDGIIVNQWLAEDIGVEEGDTIMMRYYVVGLLRDLQTEKRTFTVRSVAPMKGVYGDEDLMPDIPGLSDAGNCRDWDTGVPIDLDSIRDKDEDYWTRYRGTPKAFVANSAGEEIWANRFGKYTSFRIDRKVEDIDSLKMAILENISPKALGFEIRSVKEQAKFAANNGVDFSQLFGGLSFFLLAGAILLTVLLFRLNLEERKEQISTLIATGITRKMITRILMWEGILIATAGAITGIILSVFYNELVFYALNSIWMEIVRTEMLVTNLQPLTLFAGFLASILIAWAAMFFPLRRFIRLQSEKYLRKTRHPLQFFGKGFIRYTALIAFAAAIVLILLQYTAGDVVNASVFFAAGGLLLVSGLLFVFNLLYSMRSAQFYVRNVTTLGFKNTLRNTTRSISIVILFAIGTFLVISTGSNRKDLFINAEDPSSGTGGFLYYAESSVPVLQNLDKERVRYNYGLSDDYGIVQMRIAEGDDASCLNLNRITNPGILGVDPNQLTGRFSFVTATDWLDKDQPWHVLKKDLPGDLVPAIADETVIKWGLGMKVGDTLEYLDAEGERMRLLLVGGLAPSIFQGNVLISGDYFLERFPDNSGTRVFLVDGNINDTAMISEELTLGMRDLGWSMEYAPARLTEFNSITNTYLSIFLVLGALGLLLGTVGLSIVLFRSVIERREELTVLRALGYGKKTIKSMVVREYASLLLAGTIIGSLAAITATLPALFSKNNDISFSFILLIVAILLINGIIWIYLMTGAALKRRILSSALRNE